MPATAVGSANGKSTSASAMRRRGKRERLSTQAKSKPNARLARLAMSALPTVTRRSANTRGRSTMFRKPCQPRPAVNHSITASGPTTMIPSHSKVRVRLGAKPGRMLGSRQEKRRAGAVVELIGPQLPCVDLVENPAIGEEFRLRLGPAAEGLPDRDEVELGKLVRIFRQSGGIARPVEIAADHVLARR